MNYKEFFDWVTVGYKDIINIERTKDRIVETNEIFTNLDFVLFGLEKTYPKSYFKDKTITYSDSCAGEGVWLVGMALKRMENGLTHEEAISNLFSIDLMEDNRQATIIRLSGNNQDLKDLLENNIVAAHGLKYHRRFDGSYPYDDEVKEQEFKERLENLFDFS
jgi:hypothetical protein